jgi:hypothetical protein
MTELSRRGLIGAAIFGAVVAPFFDGTEAYAAKHARSLYSRKRFAALRGRKFRLVGPAGSTPVRLVRIADLVATPHGDDHRFALHFGASKGGPEQGTYTLRRRGFAPTTLFVVPDAHRRTYEAVVFRAP